MEKDGSDSIQEPLLTSQENGHCMNEPASTAVLGERRKKSDWKSLLNACAFTINFIFGAGILGVPIAFVSGGILAGCCTLSLVSVLSAASMVWEVEAIARAEALVALDEQLKHYPVDTMPLLATRYIPHYSITPGRFDISQLCGYFLGNRYAVFYQCCLWLNNVSTMWFYTIIFAVSMAGAIPLGFLTLPNGQPTTECPLSENLWSLSYECHLTYMFFWALFVCLTLTLSSQNISDQKGVQKALTTFGLSCILTMVCTAGVALFKSTYSGTEHFPRSHIAQVPLLFHAKGFSRAFNTFVFAQLAQPGVPQLMQAMDNSRQAKSVFSVAVTVTTICYILLGITCAFFFGSGVNDAVTLNWKNYTAEHEGANVFSKIISYMVRLFPVFTVSAAFPLNAICLGDAFFTSVCAVEDENFEDSFRFCGLKLKKRTLCVWTACIVPLLGATALTNIAFLTSVIGLLGFFLAFIFPGILQLVSLRAISQRFPEWTSLLQQKEYSFLETKLKKLKLLFYIDASKNQRWILSSRICVIFALLFSAASICYTLSTSFVNM